MWLSLIFGGVGAIFLWMVLGTLFHQHWVQRLPPRTRPGSASETAAQRNRPRCSFVIAARDEQARIEQTLRHLLAQEDVDLEVIVVDDRSTDNTSAILLEWARRDPRIKFKHIDVLPQGWLGKCHACHVGAGLATGDWILFTDADCWLSTDVVSRAVALAEAEAADHVTLTAGPGEVGIGAKAWHLAFLITLSNMISGVNRDRPRGYFGIGAFNLVRASAYRACGGYEALRLTVLDDVKLGLLLRRAGKRTRAFIGGQDVECHWGTTVGSLVRVMEKNYFAAIDFKWGLALAAATGGGALLFAPILGPLTGTITGWLAGCAPFLFVFPGLVFARRLGWSWGMALLTPFVFPVLYYAMLNSVFVTLRQKGIWWRETFYDLAVLRKGLVR